MKEKLFSWLAQLQRLAIPLQNHRGSYMSVHVLLNELGGRDKALKLFFATSLIHLIMQDLNHMTFKSIKNRIFGLKMSMF